MGKFSNKFRHKDTKISKFTRIEPQKHLTKQQNTSQNSKLLLNEVYID